MRGQTALASAAFTNSGVHTCAVMTSFDSPVLVRNADGEAVAGLSISMPSVRYDPHRLHSWVAAIAFAARDIEAELAAPPSA